MDSLFAFGFGFGFGPDSAFVAEAIGNDDDDDDDDAVGTSSVIVEDGVVPFF